MIAELAARKPRHEFARTQPCQAAAAPYPAQQATLVPVVVRGEVEGGRFRAALGLSGGRPVHRHQVREAVAQRGGVAALLVDIGRDHPVIDMANHDAKALFPEPNEAVQRFHENARNHRQDEHGDRKSQSRTENRHCPLSVSQITLTYLVTVAALSRVQFLVCDAGRTGAL